MEIRHTSEITKKLRYLLIFCCIFFIAGLQVWVSCVLLLTRKAEMLMLCNISTSAFWAWCGWGLWLRRYYAATALVSLLLTATILFAALALSGLLGEGEIFPNCLCGL
jgi:hypothetical protein